MTTTFEPFTSSTFPDPQSIPEIATAYDSHLGVSAIQHLTMFCSMKDFLPTIQNLSSIVEQFNNEEWVDPQIKNLVTIIMTSPFETKVLVRDICMMLKSHKKPHTEASPDLIISNKHSPDFIVASMFFPEVNSMDVVLQMIRDTGFGVPQDVNLNVKTVYNGSSITLTKKYDWEISGGNFTYEETQSIKALEMPTNNKPEMYSFLVDVFSWFLHSRNFSAEQEDSFISMFSIVNTFAGHQHVPKVLRDLAKASLQNPLASEMRDLFSAAQEHMSS